MAFTLSVSTAFVANEGMVNETNDNAHGPGVAHLAAYRFHRHSVAMFTSDGHIRTLAEIEGDVVRLACILYGGSMSEVARRLRVGRSKVYRTLGRL